LHSGKSFYGARIEPERNREIMPAALLTDRCVLRVAGDPARHFLNNLVTSGVETLKPGEARYAALLTPQGKIIADFLVLAAPDGAAAFYLDCPAMLAAELLQKLTFYRLRAKVAIEKTDLAVLAVWGQESAPAQGVAFADPRLEALGLRVLVTPEVTGALTLLDASAYDAHRIALGVPKGGADFRYNDAFPHDADLDKLNGVDFKKGCFIGQEVVSRVEHRGTARNRIVPVGFERAAPPVGASVMAGGKVVGTMGSSAGEIGLAMLRIDRVADALAAGADLSVDGVALHLREGFADFLENKQSKTAG
jgi:folate-binding protein YgfZ